MWHIMATTSNNSGWFTIEVQFWDETTCSWYSGVKQPNKTTFKDSCIASYAVMVIHVSLLLCFVVLPALSLMSSWCQLWKGLILLDTYGFMTSHRLRRLPPILYSEKWSIQTFNFELCHSRSLKIRPDVSNFRSEATWTWLTSNDLPPFSLNQHI